MNRVKKIFALLFAIMAVMLMSTAVWAEVTKYDLYVCKTRVTSDNANDILGNKKFSYDADNNILYIKGDHDYVSSDRPANMITSGIDDLTINVVNDSVIGFDASNFLMVENNTTITGAGKLTLKNLNIAYHSCGFGFVKDAKLTLKDINIDMQSLSCAAENNSVYDNFYSLKMINSQISATTRQAFLKDLDMLEFEDCAVTEPTDAVIDNANIYTNENGVLTPVKSVVITPQSGYNLVSGSKAYNLTVGGVDVWSYNADDILGDRHAKYDPDENVLYIYGDINYGIVNKIDGLTINVVNDSTIKLGGGTGISCQANTNITGEGTLSMTGTWNYEYGVSSYSGSTVNIENANIIINTGHGMLGDNYTPCKLTVKNSIIDITASAGSAIDFKDGGTIELQECAITTPASAVINKGMVYESDGSTLAQKVVIEPGYALKFESGAGLGSMRDVNVGKGKTYTLPDCTFAAPTDGHYYFKGWLINDTVYQAGAEITPTSDMTAVAQWQKYHFVKYYSDNNATQIKQNVINDGITTPLLSYESCNFTKPAYKDFDHWEIDGQEYKPGDKITVTKDTDVYAIYKDRLFAVSFDTAGLCTPPETQYIAYGGTVSDPGTPFAKGYTFVGWYSDSSFKDIYKINDFGNSMYAVNGDTVYYACFKKAVDDYVEVTGFDTNIHSGMSYYTKDILSVPDGANYQIGGIEWYASDGSWNNSQWDDGRVSFTAGKEYYAEILIKPNSGLTFGSGTINDKLVSLNDGQSLIDFDNSTFGSYSIYLRTKPVTALGSCEVLFMANGGTGNMDDVKVAQGTKFILPECAFTAPEGKYFVGWTRSNFGYEFDPVGEPIDVGESITPTANNMFFFAQWADKGDVNADGKITDADAALVLKYISGTTTLTSGQLEMAKMTGDDVVDMLDVIGILKNKTA